MAGIYQSVSGCQRGLYFITLFIDLLPPCLLLFCGEFLGLSGENSFLELRFLVTNIRLFALHVKIEYAQSVLDQVILNF